MDVHKENTKRLKSYEMKCLKSITDYRLYNIKRNKRIGRIRNGCVNDKLEGNVISLKYVFKV